MKLLMTGATGFLGSALLTRLLDIPGKHEVTILKRSFSDTRRIAAALPLVRSFDLDRQPLEEAFRDQQYDCVLHCATNYGRQEGEAARSNMIETNLLLPLRLLELGASHGIRHFVNTDTLLDKRVSPYALSKRQFREWLKHFAELIGTTTVSIEHFYGPDDDPKKFVAYIVQSMLAQAPSLALTPGEQLRDFIFIDDVVSAFEHILDALQGQRTGYVEYEVGTGNTISIRDFVSLAKQICGNQTTVLDFGAVAYRPNEPMTVKVDTSRLAATGWQPRIGVEEGLRRTFEFEKDWPQ